MKAEIQRLQKQAAYNSSISMKLYQANQANQRLRQHNGMLAEKKRALETQCETLERTNIAFAGRRDLLGDFRESIRMNHLYKTAIVRYQANEEALTTKELELQKYYRDRERKEFHAQIAELKSKLDRRFWAKNKVRDITLGENATLIQQNSYLRARLDEHQDGLNCEYSMRESDEDHDGGYHIPIRCPNGPDCEQAMLSQNHCINYVHI